VSAALSDPSLEMICEPDTVIVADVSKQKSPEHAAAHMAKAELEHTGFGVA
jgi:hypothetical protein